MATRVLRVIARMNVGGPAHHVSLLGGRLDRDRFDTLLVHGSVGAGEASSRPHPATAPSAMTAVAASTR